LHKEKPMQTIGFVGAGNMAEALIKGILAAKAFKSGNIMISDIRHERLGELSARYGVAIAKDNTDLAARADIIVLAVKPQVMADALAPLKAVVSPDRLVISIAAGIRTDKIAAIIGNVPIIRAMPNTPALVGEGASVLYANPPAQKHLDTAMKLFSAVGFATSVADEALLDAVTAVSGSGPAYYFLMMEEMVKGAVAIGLTPRMARDLVLQTAKGAAILAAEADKAGETAAELRRKVTSPKGTTEAAMNVMINGGSGEIIIRAIKAARDRSIELSA
jgi:pyrroline-5-carboxylate reductase